MSLVVIHLMADDLGSAKVIEVCYVRKGQPHVRNDQPLTGKVLKKFPETTDAEVM